MTRRARSALVLLASAHAWLACFDRAPPPGTPAAKTKPSLSCPSTPSAQPIASTSASPVATKECEHVFPTGTPEVAVAWSDCAKADNLYFPVAERGFPAVSSDGKRVVVLEHFMRPLTVGDEPTALSIRSVDDDKEVKHLLLHQPQGGDDVEKARARATGPLAQAKTLIAETKWIPMRACEGPFPSHGICRSAHPLTQTMTCLHDAVSAGGPPFVDVDRSIDVRFTTPRLTLSADGKAPFLQRDLYVHRYNSLGNAKGPLDATVDPYVAATWVDFERRALVIHIRYCNTFDTQPMVDDAVHVYRTPKT